MISILPRPTGRAASCSRPDRAVERRAATWKLSSPAIWPCGAGRARGPGAADPPSPRTLTAPATSLPGLCQPSRSLLELYVAVAHPLDERANRLFGIIARLGQYAVLFGGKHDLLFRRHPQPGFQAGIGLAKQPGLAVVDVGLVVVQLAIEYLGAGQLERYLIAFDSDVL